MVTHMTQALVKESTLSTRPYTLGLLDFCKGLAILFVVLLHYEGGWFGWQAVHVFIVLSGFGLTYARLNQKAPLPWNQWYQKRFLKILPAYWAVCLSGAIVLVITQLLDGSSLLAAISFPKRLLLFEVTLLKNLSNSTIVAFPNFALWFVPFIVSFYLIYPWLYRLMTHRRTQWGVLTVFLGLVIVEFGYRLIALLWLDGSPIGYRNFEPLFASLDVPLDLIPNDGFPFQGEAPFGIMLARIGEFALGMVGAISLTTNQQQFQKIVLHPCVGALGFGIWLMGDALLYVGFYGWIVADFVIALGLILWFINLARFCQISLTPLFRTISQLGQWAYYVFLTHCIFIYLLLLYMPQKLSIDLSLLRNDSVANAIFSLGVAIIIIGGTGLSSWLLQRLDQSKVAERWFQGMTRLKKSHP